MKKNLLTFIFIVLLANLGLYAEHKYSKPGKSEVVFVFSYNLRPAINREFYKGYAGEGNDAKDQIFIPAQPKVWFAKDSYAPVDDLISIAIRPSKEGIVKFGYFEHRLFEFITLSIYFPLDFQVKVPKGVKYVYLGHFDYKRKSVTNGKYVDIQRSDNYDAAVKIIKKRYGKEAELVRLPLQELKEK